MDAKADLFVDNNGIFRWNFHLNADILIEDAEIGYKITEDILSGKKTPVLVDMRCVRRINKASRDYYKDNALKFFSAGAIIIGSPISKIIANFFMGLNRPLMPMRIVTSEKEGVEWLSTFL